MKSLNKLNVGTIYLLGKNAEGLNQVAQTLKQANGIVKEVDLSSFHQVRKFVQEFKNEQTRLDILVNNAAVVQLPYTLSGEGVEMQMQVNYLSHHLLTQLLLPLLRKSERGRIINVSSRAAHFGVIDYSLWEEKYEGKKKKKNPLLNNRLTVFVGSNSSPRQLYANSKFATVLSTSIMAERLKRDGIKNVMVNAVHPGIVITNAGNNNEKEEAKFVLT